MKRKIMPTDTFPDAIPEIDQHEVRYSEYVLKSYKNSISPEKRQFSSYGVGINMDSEIDDDADINYLNYVLPRFDIESLCQKEKKENKSSKFELTLESIFKELHDIKLSKIQKIVIESKPELTKALSNTPNKTFLSMAKTFYSTMFNPEQKFWIYMYVRKTLNVSRHACREALQHIYNVLAPKAAVIIFQKIYKIDSLDKAITKLAALELMNSTFYSNKAKVNMHCRT